MHHTIARMNAFNKSFLNSKECYKKMQKHYLASKNKFAFFPMQDITTLDMATSIQYQQGNQQALNVLCQLYLYGTWRNTLGIYQLDDEIVKDSKALPDDTPTSIFLNLPEWCVYVDIASAMIAVIDEETLTHIKGFWAVYDVIEVNNIKHKAINFIVDTDSDDNLFVPQPLFLGDDMTVEQSIAYMNSLEPRETAIIKGLLPYLLWLCVEQPDITHKNIPVSRDKLTQPKYGVNKKTGTFVPPSEPTIYQIGTRLGQKVREYQAKIDEHEKKGKTTSLKRPHIRRGHWHGHWRGKRGSQEQTFEVKWQPAIFVNG